MRLVNRTAFMSLPEGTLFIKGSPKYMDFTGPLCAKEETIKHPDTQENIDWFYRDLCEIEAHDSNARAETWVDMMNHGFSVSMETHSSRDGCFEPTDLFLIYEEEDLRLLAVAVEDARFHLGERRSGRNEGA